MSGITDIKGIKVGHYTDREAMTGCTALLFETGAVAGVDVRGSAPGTRETDLLRGYNLVERVNCIMLSGGSAYGLDAASGAMEFLEEKGMGFDSGNNIKVPIVPAAVIYDLGIGNSKVRPGKKEGYLACKNAASHEVEYGRVGAGTGATYGKLNGPEHAQKGGIGAYCVDLGNGIKLAAIMVVNALGNVYDHHTGAMLGGSAYPQYENTAFGNTTIGVIATNAKLTREEANKLAAIAHDGLALAIRPVHTSMDGDTVFAASTCEFDGIPFIMLQAAASEVVANAIADAVKRREAEGK